MKTIKRLCAALAAVCDFLIIAVMTWAVFAPICLVYYNIPTFGVAYAIAAALCPLTVTAFVINEVVNEFRTLK